MPSFLHDALLELFRARRGLAVELLQGVFDMKLPAFDRIEVGEADLTELSPSERRADLVLLLYRGAPVLVIVVEVQLGRDPRKPFTWPTYATHLRARHECPVVVLVVTPSAKIARWAARPVNLGAGQTWAPVVLGPTAIPKVGPEQALTAPELCVLAAVAHAHQPDGLRQALDVIPAVYRLDDDKRDMYCDLIMTALPKAAREELEAMALSGKYEFQSEFAKKYIALGKQVGEQEGEQRGEQRGEQKGAAKALLLVMEHRGLRVDDALRARVTSASPETLERWMRRVLDGGRLDELFGDG